MMRQYAAIMVEFLAKQIEARYSIAAMQASANFYTRNQSSSGHFKMNQRKERKLSRRRKMKASAR